MTLEIKCKRIPDPDGHNPALLLKGDWLIIEIVEKDWADVIMPDVKHVGGFGAMADVVVFATGKVEISPHNPSGPISTAASLHAAAISNDVTSLEVPLIVDDKRAYYMDWMECGSLRVPEGTGWGIDFEFD